MRIRVVHALIDEVDGIEVLRGRSGAHKANVEYKPEYMSKGNSHV